MWWLDLLGKTRQRVDSCKVLWRHMRKHPVVYSLLGGAVVAVFAGYLTIFFCFIQPARRTLSSFYGAIDNEQYREAWELLDRPYQKRWQGGLSQFQGGYGTTVKHTDLEISDWFSLRQLTSALFGKCIELDVTYRVIDRFDRDTFADPIQYSNRLTVELLRPTEYRQLMDGTLPGGESTVELTRVFQKHVTLSRKPGGWRISSLEPRSMSFEMTR
jgi:hypothetical protein